MRRIKNQDKISKEGLIIALLKSKRGLAELFNNNSDNDRIRGNKKILDELRDKLTKQYRKEIKKKRYEIENEKNPLKLEKEEINNILMNQKEFLKKKNIVIMIVMILIAMEQETQEIYLVKLMKRTITNIIQKCF